MMDSAEEVVSLAPFEQWLSEHLYPLYRDEVQKLEPGKLKDRREMTVRIVVEIWDSGVLGLCELDGDVGLRRAPVDLWKSCKSATTQQELEPHARALARFLATFPAHTRISVNNIKNTVKLAKAWIANDPFIVRLANEHSIMQILHNKDKSKLQAISTIDDHEVSKAKFVAMVTQIDEIAAPFTDLLSKVTVIDQDGNDVKITIRARRFEMVAVQSLLKDDQDFISVVNVLVDGDQLVKDLVDKLKTLAVI